MQDLKRCVPFNDAQYVYGFIARDKDGKKELSFDSIVLSLSTETDRCLTEFRACKSGKFNVHTTLLNTINHLVNSEIEFKEKEKVFEELRNIRPKYTMMVLYYLEDGEIQSIAHWSMNDGMPICATVRDEGSVVLEQNFEILQTLLDEVSDASRLGTIEEVHQVIRKMDR